MCGEGEEGDEHESHDGDCTDECMMADKAMDKDGNPILPTEEDLMAAMDRAGYRQ